MCEGPDDIPAATQLPHSSVGRPNALPALPSDAALAAPKLDESDYLENIAETFSEWNSLEDEVAFRNL